MSDTTTPQPETAAAEARIEQLQLALTEARDHALAAEAQLGRAQAEREEIRERLRSVRDDRDRLVAELDVVRRTTTWRVGSAIVKPVARIRRRRPEA